VKGRRKVFIATLVVVATTFVAMAGYLTGEFTSVMIAVIAAFSAANAYEHHRNGTTKPD
jgi:hypothetical protein